MVEVNKIYILQHRRGWNFLRWLWESTNLFVTIQFHDIRKEISKLPKEGGEIIILKEEYLDFQVEGSTRMGGYFPKGRMTSILIDGDDLFVMREDSKED